MKLMFASDIHGSAYYCRKMLEAFQEEKAERLVLLGDILYHGPRNDLPKEYAPKEVIALLPRYTRITIVASGDEQILEQIEKQLAKLEDVVDIKKLEPGSSVTRELILVKIRAKDTERQPILNVTEIFHGKIVDVTNDSMVIELTGHQDKLEAFLDLLQGYDILELARTGITGLSRGTADVKIME